jgi:hypothetical protein
MQHFLFVESFEYLLIVGLLPGQKVGLGGDRIFPFLWVILVLFVRFLRLLFQLLQFLFLPVDDLYFLFDLPYLNSVYPDVFSLLIGYVLAEPNLVVTDSLPQLVSFHFVTLYDILEHLLFTSCKQILFNL